MIDERLPLPENMGGLDKPFGELVDVYTEAERITRAEAFRRIAAVTGNSVNGVSLRYYQRGGEVWRVGGAG